MKIYPLLMLGALLGLSQCQKKDPAPVDQLPPATQTGANTFGCLLNGQPWTPNGNNGVPNYRVSYDPGYAGGNISIRAYRYLNASDNSQQYMTLGGNRIDRLGSYPLVLVGDRTVFYYDRNLPAPCNEYRDPPVLAYRKGILNITRLDLQAGIVAGTFSFTLYQPGCDSVRVTQGRFDKKL
ncbi:hypothetical protein [Hymenobacter glacialis]|uniref:Uncharacterized protein n=1 Tax=Hymenobacter glacialis TaxID=1908236 RepID=A0A1G1SSF3_9BACT|nr:hypothetical protein [Hymenobacter glacialis]OGX81550.1 hypothetical protein BEN48_17750 [Hymenobacter glacialis]